MKQNAVIENRDTGETLTILIGEEENAGALQLYRVLLPAHRTSPPLHYHVSFTETFTVLKGTLDIYLGRERRHQQLHSGELVTVQRYEPHTFANTSDRPCIMTVETKPAGGW
jgi:quercetin dioxygenase-like cupin family protein